MFETLKIIIVAENASARMGGEAILPLHYFKFLACKGVNVWLLTHERVKNELYETLAEKDFQRVYFVSDTKLQVFCERVRNYIPDYLAESIIQWIIHASTDARQRIILKSLVEKHQINIVHQPMPVSPKVPSFIYDVGAPVIIGSMNGGMRFPPAFADMTNVVERFIIWIGHAFSEIINHLLPGKKKAALLLVANERTRHALPQCACANVLEFTENGVDLTLWQIESREKKKHCSSPIFIFLGFLKSWKGVHLLLYALSIALKQESVSLRIVGDGVERAKLEVLAYQLGIAEQVQFFGFVPQEQCPPLLCESRALILPSLLECGGAVVLEAMAVGIPVIAANWGGPADYLTEECGILVEPCSKIAFIRGLAEAMVRLARDEQLAQQMGEQGRKRVESLFSWQAKIEQMIEIYIKVADTSKEFKNFRVDNNR